MRDGFDDLIGWGSSGRRTWPAGLPSTTATRTEGREWATGELLHLIIEQGVWRQP
jgi:hypothetical protein